MGATSRDRTPSTTATAAAPAPAPATAPAKRILVIRLSSLGDVLMTFPAVQALRTAHPTAHITYLVDRRFATLPRACPAVDDVIALDKRGLKRLQKSAWGTAYTTLKRLVTGRFDLVVDLHSYAETGFLSALTQAPMRIGRKAKTWGVWYTHYFPHPVEPRPLTVQHVDLLKFANVVPASMPPPPLRVVPDADAVEQAQQWVQAQANVPGKRVLAVFPGASRPEKCWPAECFSALIAETLSAFPDTVAVVFGGPNEEATIAAMQGRLQEFWPRLLVTPPFLPMPFVAAVQALAPMAFVSNDTGPMHVAVASGACRVIALYREPNPHFQPSPPHVVLTAPAGDLRRITVASVFDAIIATLPAPPFISGVTPIVEHAAGFIVFTRSIPSHEAAIATASAAVAPKTEREVRFLLMRNAKHQSWGFPKGHLEPGESAIQAARRELQEETGFTPDIGIHHAGFSGQLQYTLPRDVYGPGNPPEPRPKTVTVFLLEVPATAVAAVGVSAEHDALQWAELATARELLQPFRDTENLLVEAAAWIDAEAPSV